jgi:hypothetical protein
VPDELFGIPRRDARNGDEHPLRDLLPFGRLTASIPRFFFTAKLLPFSFTVQIYNWADRADTDGFFGLVRVLEIREK